MREAYTIFQIWYHFQKERDLRNVFILKLEHDDRPNRNLTTKKFRNFLEGGLAEGVPEELLRISIVRFVIRLFIVKTYTLVLFSRSYSFRKCSQNYKYLYGSCKFYVLNIGIIIYRYIAYVIGRVCSTYARDKVYGITLLSRWYSFIKLN